MKQFTYIKLNDYEPQNARFPLDFSGVFNDGVNSFPVFDQLQGNIQFQGESDSIVEMDKAYLAHTQQKKIPPDVVVQIN